MGDSKGEAAIVGQHQKAFRLQIQPAGRKNAHADGSDQIHNGGAALWVLDGAEATCVLVHRVVHEWFLFDRSPVDANGVAGWVDSKAHLSNGDAVHLSPARGDQALRGPAGRNPGAGEESLESFG